MSSTLSAELVGTPRHTRPTRRAMFPVAQLPPAQYYSIDVECVATGTDHNSRAVGQISLVVSMCCCGRPATVECCEERP